MSKKTLYSILSALLLLLALIINHFQDKKIIENNVLKGAEIKLATKTFFLPTSTTGQVIHHEGYSLSYSEAHEQAEWVAYELKPEHISNNNFKRPYFEIDKHVKTGAASWRNYKNSGYDKGHLCPAADRRFTKKAHDETFLTSNITPQEHNFNAGLWNLLEQQTRYWAKIYNGVFVVSGGVLSENLKTIGNEHVAVPNKFYKIILDYNNEQPKVIAFITKHEDSKLALTNFVVSVDEVERLTGIDFFSELDDAIETKLEASNTYENWRF